MSAHSPPVNSSEDKASSRRRRGAPRRGEAREALMQAALELVASEANFSAISLRRIARQAGVVPTAFYRHFEDLDALGLTLIEDTFRSLRQILSDASLSALPLKGLVRYSVELFAHYVRDNRLLFQFVVKERFSGTVAMREAIHNEILLVTNALAADLARFDEFSHISQDDLRTISDLVVNTVITLSERILDVDPDNAEDDALMLRAEKQLRLIFMGVGRWESRPADTDTTA
ncbi:TetR family transcriptional regulator [Salinisphaera dokdonensis CL-ES53]|uniref:TetR family transcriptional regulator n=1 Tax=Salinisphaera dokdonensis CL-ES53 TaxID=1304272 RepID=A0ABV2B1G8_9GAMM